jgi:hypothetical protein
MIFPVSRTLTKRSVSNFALPIVVFSFFILASCGKSSTQPAKTDANTVKSLPTRIYGEDGTGIVISYADNSNLISEYETIETDYKFTYNAANQPVKIIANANGEITTITFTLNSSGKITRADFSPVRDGTAYVTFEYNGANQITGVKHYMSYGLYNTFTFTLNSNGSIKNVTSTRDGFVYFEYDVFNGEFKNVAYTEMFLALESNTLNTAYLSRLNNVIRYAPSPDKIYTYNYQYTDDNYPFKITRLLNGIRIVSTSVIYK